nr:D-glycero-beta-D-manno-heptose 1,7-bisphosphate 7-phosphatase [Campylobacter sp.]
MKKAVFLDRDGVINEDSGYVSKISDFKFINGVFEALRGFKELGYLLIIVTNQSGISRGFYTLDDFEKLNKFMLDEFTKNGVFIDKVYFCPHSPEENCECRKPKAGMILQGLKEFDINPQNSILIGDKISDIEAANAANLGCAYQIGKDGGSLREIYEIIKEKL